MKDEMAASSACLSFVVQEILDRSVELAKLFMFCGVDIVPQHKFQRRIRIGHLSVHF